MVESFETYRSYLFAIAYRMLGSAMDAEDMVQETYLRYSTTPPETITSLKAFLTTILTRLCMDQLHLARRKREVYPGPWLPEPIITTTALESSNPEERVARGSAGPRNTWPPTGHASKLRPKRSGRCSPDFSRRCRPVR